MTLGLRTGGIKSPDIDASTAREPETDHYHTWWYRRGSHQYFSEMSSDEQLYLSLKAKVKSASRAIMTEPDWAANMEIVDMCNDKPIYIPHIARILKKRICHWNPNVGFLALTLVEALVKNCSDFHPFVTSNEFVDSMLKELYRKKEKKTLLQHIQIQQQNVSEVSRLQRRDKILLLIENWGESAKVSKSFDIYRVTYNDLKRQGFSFPVPLKDEVSPVFTPKAKPSINSSADDSGPVKDQHLQEYLANIELFMDTLNEANPDEPLQENDVVQALKSTLESAQSKIMNRIGSDPSEELMNELLLVNDELCQALDYYKKVITGKLKHKKHIGPKPVRGKGQRVSAFQPQFADLLGVTGPAIVKNYTSDSEDESPENSGADSESENEIEPKELDVTQYKEKEKKIVVSSSGKSEPSNTDLFALSKGIAPPRSNNKTRILKTTQSNESNQSKDQWSKDSQYDNPFDLLDSNSKEAQPAGPNPFATGDELLSSLVSVPNKSKPGPKKPDISMFDPL